MQNTREYIAQASNLGNAKKRLPTPAEYRHRRVVAAVAAVAVLAGGIIAGVKGKSAYESWSRDEITGQNAEALQHTGAFRDGQLYVSAGTRTYDAPDTAEDTGGMTISDAQSDGVVPKGGYSIVYPLEYRFDGQAWYGFVDPRLGHEANPAKKIRWVNGAALNTKDDNGYDLANWEGGLVPQINDHLGFDKMGNPINTLEPLQDDVTHARVGLVDTYSR